MRDTLDVDCGRHLDEVWRLWLDESNFRDRMKSQERISTPKGEPGGFYKIVPVLVGGKM